MTPVPMSTALPGRRRSATVSSHVSPCVVTLAVAGTSLLFYIFPSVDLSVSRWFYQPNVGFALADSALLRVLRSSSTWVMSGVLLLCALQLIRHAVAGQVGGRVARRCLWLLACLAAGPGLLVNGILKEYWGRPRPIATDLFGGEAPFQRVWVISNWCDRNCSFVSGEASSAAWLVAAALIAPRQIRTAAVAAATLYAFALSINRIAFGGHYLSDVVLAWLLCALVFMGLGRLILTTAGEEADRLSSSGSSEGFRP